LEKYTPCKEQKKTKTSDTGTVFDSKETAQTIGATREPIRKRGKGEERGAQSRNCLKS